MQPRAHEQSTRHADGRGKCPLHVHQARRCNSGVHSVTSRNKTDPPPPIRDDRGIRTAATRHRRPRHVVVQLHVVLLVQVRGHVEAKVDGEQELQLQRVHFRGRNTANLAHHTRRTVNERQRSMCTRSAHGKHASYKPMACSGWQLPDQRRHHEREGNAPVTAHAWQHPAVSHRAALPWRRTRC